MKEERVFIAKAKGGGAGGGGTFTKSESESKSDCCDSNVMVIRNDSDVM